MAIENNIGYPAGAAVGDILTAVAAEESATNRLGFYSVKVTNQGGAVVATFRGTVYRTHIEHMTLDSPTDSSTP